MLVLGLYTNFKRLEVFTIGFTSFTKEVYPPTLKDLASAVGNMSWRDRHGVDEFYRLHCCPNFRSFQFIDMTSETTLLWVGVRQVVPSFVNGVNSDLLFSVSFL